jgi:hypothetical protein
MYVYIHSIMVNQAWYIGTFTQCTWKIIIFLWYTCTIYPTLVCKLAAFSLTALWEYYDKVGNLPIFQLYLLNHEIGNMWPKYIFVFITTGRYSSSKYLGCIFLTGMLVKAECLSRETTVHTQSYIYIYMSQYVYMYINVYMGGKHASIQQKNVQNIYFWT